MSDEPDPYRESETPDVAVPPDEERIEALITRLARPHRSGGRVIERASLLSAGPDFGAAVAWIEAHGGTPELPTVPSTQPGLHSPRLADTAAHDPKPLRFILPIATPR